jgi:hypothetical protein
MTEVAQVSGPPFFNCKSRILTKKMVGLHFGRFLQSRLITLIPWYRTANHLEPILRLLNLQLQRQRCSRLERFYVRRKICVVIKTRHAIT